MLLTKLIFDNVYISSGRANTSSIACGYPVDVDAIIEQGISSWIKTQNNDEENPEIRFSDFDKLKNFCIEEINSKIEEDKKIITEKEHLEANRLVWDMMLDVLKSYSPEKIKSILENNKSLSAKAVFVSAILKQTDEWYQRFTGNERIFCGVIVGVNYLRGYIFRHLILNGKGLDTIFNSISIDKKQDLILICNYYDQLLGMDAVNSGVVSGLLLAGKVQKNTHPDFMLRQHGLPTLTEKTAIENIRNQKVSTILLIVNDATEETTGEIYLNPSADIVRIKQTEQMLEKKRLELQYAHNGYPLASRTIFDREYPVLANVARVPGENILQTLQDALSNGADGIGLISTEIILHNLKDSSVNNWDNLLEEEKEKSKLVQLFSEIFLKIEQELKNRESIKSEGFYDHRTTDEYPFVIGIRLPDIQPMKGGSDIKTIYSAILPDTRELWDIEFSRSAQGQKLSNIILEALQLSLKYHSTNFYNKKVHIEVYGPGAKNFEDYKLFSSLIKPYKKIIHEGIMLEHELDPKDLEKIIQYLKINNIYPHIGTNDLANDFSEQKDNEGERNSSEYNFQFLKYLSNFIGLCAQNGNRPPIICGGIAENPLLLIWASYSDKFSKVFFSVPAREIKQIKGNIRSTSLEEINPIQKLMSSLTELVATAERKNVLIQEKVREINNSSTRKKHQEEIRIKDQEMLDMGTQQIEETLNKEEENISLYILHESRKKELATALENFAREITHEKHANLSQEDMESIFKAALFEVIRNFGITHISAISQMDYNYKFKRNLQETIPLDTPDIVQEGPISYFYRTVDEQRLLIGFYDKRDKALRLRYGKTPASSHLPTPTYEFIHVVIKDTSFSIEDIESVFDHIYSMICLTKDEKKKHSKGPIE